MTRPQYDPWAPSEKWQPYERPREDGFSPMDTQAADLNTFLRGEEAQAILCNYVRKTNEEQTVGKVMLPDGRPAQLTQRPDGSWELAIHVKRDWFQILTASSRDEVLRMAEAEMRRRTAL
jgi:hypothetical protein